jgi:hypothetical protein
MCLSKHIYQQQFRKRPQQKEQRRMIQAISLFQTSLSKEFRVLIRDFAPDGQIFYTWVIVLPLSSYVPISKTMRVLRA